MKVIESRISEEDIQEAKRLEDNPELILRLIDLLFLGYENGKEMPS